MDFLVRAKTIQQEFEREIDTANLKLIDGVWYAIGFYLPTVLDYDSFMAKPEDTILVRTPHNEDDEESYYYEQFLVDGSTRAIHFEDMIDTDGTKIFASLSEDGKGGDALEDLTEYFEGATIVAKYKNNEFVIDEESDKKSGAFIEKCNNLENWKVTGIQE